MNNRKKVTASITVEATLIMPIFLFALVAFLFFFQIFQLQEDIQESITRVSKVASQYGYVYEYLQNTSNVEETKQQEEKTQETAAAKQAVQGFIDGSLFKLQFLEYMKTRKNDNCIVGGLQGISFLESSFMKQDKDIEVIAVYTVKIPVLFFNLKPFRVVQRVHSRAFVGRSLLEGVDTGEGTGEDTDEYVYITRTGTKYHNDYNCTYLNVKLTTVKGSAIAEKRSSDGSKYYPCESCMSGTCKDSGTYYITKYGNRYHASSKCNKIERDITKIKKSEVGGRTPCSKCGK